MNRFIFTALMLNLIHNITFAQYVEVYAGNKRFGIDVLWFKNVQNKKQEKTRYLFISRNRASTDYVNAQALISSTNAISYHLISGIGIIGVAYFSTNGFIPKLGIQYTKNKNDFMFFGWLVADLKHEGGIEIFSVFRYQPSINAAFRVLSQLELVPVYNLTNGMINFTQRIRLGLKHNS